MDPQSETLDERGQMGPGSHPRRSGKEMTVCVRGRTPKSQLRCSGKWSRTCWCIPCAEDVLEVREHGGSDVLGARE